MDAGLTHNDLVELRALARAKADQHRNVANGWHGTDAYRRANASESAQWDRRALALAQMAAEAVRAAA